MAISIWNSAITFEGKGTLNKGRLTISCKMAIMFHTNFIENFMNSCKATFPIIMYIIDVFTI